MAEDLERDYTINGKRSAETLGYRLRHLRAGFAMLHAVDITTDRIRSYEADLTAAADKLHTHLSQQPPAPCSR